MLLAFFSNLVKLKMPLIFFMKRPSLLFVPFILVSLGLSACQVAKQEPIIEESSETPVASESEETTTVEWKEEASVHGLIFSYPEDWTYQGGGDTDTGSYSSISKGDEAYFRILDKALLKCEEADPSDCNLETLAAGTPREVFDATLAEMAANEFYRPAGTVVVGNVSGEAFDFREKNSDGSVRRAVVIYGKEGVYVLEDIREAGAQDELWGEFLASFKVD